MKDRTMIPLERDTKDLLKAICKRENLTYSEMIGEFCRNYVYKDVLGIKVVK